MSTPAPDLTVVSRMLPSDEAAELVVLRASGTSRAYWRELWKFRELFYFLAWRDLKVRYKQTVIGVAWAVIRPLLTMVIFTVVFGRLARLPSAPDIPYPVLVLAGLVAWQFFATVMSEGSQSIISNANLITKVYFPRVIVPASVLAVALADFAVTAALLLLLMAWYATMPSWHIIFLPAFLLIAIAAALGVSLWLSALTVRYRDMRFVIPFIVQFGLYVTPVGFTTARVPTQYQLLFGLNPMVGVIEGFRWSLLGTGILGHGILPASVVMSLVLLLTGFRYFRATERTFADTI